MSEPGPPSPKQSSTKPLGKGEVGGDAAKGASEEEQRPDFFAKKGEDYQGGSSGADASGGAAAAASGAADALSGAADKDKASRTNA